MKRKIPPRFKHQNTSLRFLKTHLIAFDMSDPGTGKTRVHIEDIADRRAKGSGAALVLCPKSLLQAAWGDDIEKYRPELKYVICPADKREKAFAEEADVYITNIDAAVWLLKQKPAFFKRFEIIVIDESTAYKHHTSARSKAVGKIISHFQVRRLLSGLPNPNGICDLWHQVKLLDDGRRLGKSFFHFRSSVCNAIQNGPKAQHIKWVDRDGAELAVTGLLKDITIRHVLEDCIDMPENTLRPIAFKLSARHQAFYDKMERDAIAVVNSQTIKAINGAVLYGKLMQVASGAAYDDLGEAAWIDSGRYELIADLCEQRPHTLVFFQWEHQRDRLIEEFEKRGLTYGVVDGSVGLKQRTEFVQYFQKGFYRVGLLHPKAAGHGLTLTKATTSIWASPTINAEWWKQANHRAYRAGQTLRTETIIIVAQKTIDERVYDACASKNFNIALLLHQLVT